MIFFSDSVLKNMTIVLASPLWSVTYRSTTFQMCCWCSECLTKSSCLFLPSMVLKINETLKDRKTP